MKPAPRRKPRPRSRAAAAPLPLPAFDLPAAAAPNPSAALDPPDFGLTWECPNCGQTFFGQQPPDLCAYCQDFTTWRRRGAS